MSSVDFEVKIENVYIDSDDEEDLDEEAPAVVTVTLEMSLDSDHFPSYGASDDEWEQWGEDNIFPHTGTYRPDGDSAYFAEITSAKSAGDQEEIEHIIGRTWEWGT